MFLTMVAFIVGGVTAKYPIAPTGKNPMTGKPNEPDPRKVQSYRNWKNLLHGLNPIDREKGGLAKQWKAWRRPSLYMFLPVGLLTGANAYSPALTFLNVLFALPVTMMVVKRQDNAADPRHPYNGVSMVAFYTKAPMPQRIACGLLSAIGFIVPSLAGFLMYLPTLTGIGIGLLVPLVCVWVFSRHVQSKPWKRLIEAQKRFDQWVGMDETMLKAYGKARVNSVKTLGDKNNPLTELYVKPDVPGGAQQALKMGVNAIQTPLYNSGYQKVWLLQALRKDKQARVIDPTTVRIVYGKDNQAFPDITHGQVKPAVAQLACDIAYAETALAWGKQAPLTQVDEIADHSGGDDRNAWIIHLIIDPNSGLDSTIIGRDWLDPGNPSPPAQTLGYANPMTDDLQHLFHLAAEEGVRFSRKADKYQPEGILTSTRDFNEYINYLNRFKEERSIWTDGIRQDPFPMPYYDTETSYTTNDGWKLTSMAYEFTPLTMNQCERLDLKQLNPEAAFVGFQGQDETQGQLITASPNAPSSLARLTGSMAAHRMLAQALAYRALVNVTGKNVIVHVTSATQEGNKDNPVWRIGVRTGDGLTIEDLRSRTAKLQAQLGVSVLLWDWTKNNEAYMWATNSLMIDPAQAGQWHYGAQHQIQFLRLWLSDAWAKANIVDDTGKAPEVLAMRNLPSNPDLIKVRFRIPRGIGMSRVDGSEEKFQSAANYGYTRILPRSDEHEGDKWDMLMCKTNPMPTVAKADWKVIRGLPDLSKIPLGVDDMGDTIWWQRKTTPHFLAAGKTGTGKTSLMQIPVAALLLHGGQLVICDPSKGAVDFTKWAKPRSLAFATTYPETEAAIKWVEHEMQRRVKLMREAGIGNITELPEDRRPPTLYVVFDEFNSYINSYERIQSNPTGDTEIANYIAQASAKNAGIMRTGTALAAITTQGRTAGISLLLGAQRLTMDDMKIISSGDKLMRSLGKFLLGTDSPMGVVSQPNESAANKLQRQLGGSDGNVPVGRGIYESADGRLDAVQSWYAGTQDDLAGIVSDVPLVEPVDLTPFMPAAAETFGVVDADEEVQQNDTGDTFEPVATEDMFDDDDNVEDVEE
jgi:hypothetical protein